jgi:hypothetical protein
VAETLRVARLIKDFFVSSYKPNSMTRVGYPYENPAATRYTFTSSGRKRIQKVVEFSDIGLKNTFNLAFGDLLPDGTIDDRAVSNNGDIAKVLATVVSIIKDFTFSNPRASIVFRGSTGERMKWYARILTSYYPIFSKEFTLSGFVRTGLRYEVVPFSDARMEEYEVFLIKRKA